MTTEAITAELKGRKEAWVLQCALTNMPYVECEEENYYDQVRIYAKKEDAEAAVKELEAVGVLVKAEELKTVEVQMPVKASEPDGEKRKMYLNQVRQYLGNLPFMGVNAVGYQPADGELVTIELAKVLPEDYEKKVGENAFYQPNLQLTGLYLMQELRKKQEFVDKKHLPELDEEFSCNLAKSHIFLAVLAPEGREKDTQLNLNECKSPYLKNKNGDIFFPLFTDIWEFQKYAVGQKRLRPFQIPFSDVTKFWVKDAKAYTLNPNGFALSLSKEMIAKVQKRFPANVK